jgi:DNA end-binding protein Ku
MAERTIWKGNIHFGDVNLPVNLHRALREDRIQFHLLHKRDHLKLRQQMVCAYEKKPVPGVEQAKGFELEEGKYIIVDPSELEQLAPESSRMIEVHEFVRREQIDPAFRERVYYLEADANLKGYSALAAVLSEMEVEGICTWTMRQRSYFGALQASGKILRLNALRYADEVISVKSLGLKQVPVSEKELKIGIDLINHMAGHFQPEKFGDEHQKKLQSLIDKKARGEKISVLRPRLLKPTASDKLLHTLEASLKKVA